MNLAPSHLLSLSPSHASSHSYRHQSTRVLALIAVVLCSATLHPVQADKAQAPLLTALEVGTPPTQISVGEASSVDAIRKNNESGSLARVARATVHRAEAKTMPPAIVAFTPTSRQPKASTAPVRVLTNKVLANKVLANGVGRTSLAKSRVIPGIRVVNGSTATPLVSGDARIRLVRSDDAPLSSLPAATLTPRAMATAKTDAGGELMKLPEMGAGSQIINVQQALKKPAPLPVGWENFTVPIDAASQSTPPETRIAQSPTAPPLRQPQAPVTSSDRLPNQIEVAASTYVVLITKVDLNTVAIADPDIADVTIVNARSVLVNGKGPGVTTLVVVDRIGKIRQYQVRVVPAQGTRDVDIARTIGIEGVGVRRIQDSIILEGEVSNADEMKRAVDIAGIFSAKVINQLRLRGGPVDEGMLTAAQIQEAIDRPEVKVRVAGKNAILDGVVANEAERQRAEMIARTYSDGVVNALRLPALTVDQLREMLGGFEQSNAAVADIGIAGQLLPPPRLVIRRVGDQVVLEGEIASQAELDAALAAASRTDLQIVNRLTIAPGISSEATLLNTVARAIGIPGIQVRGTAKRLVLVGQVIDTNAAVAAEQIARGFAQEVDNLLQTPNPLSVNIDVSIVEISRNNARNLGIELGSTTLLTETITPDGRTTTTAGDFNLGSFLGGENVAGNIRNLNPFRARLNALYTNGDARLLSNPRTTVLSGRTATFQVGGQVPIPAGSTTNGAGTSTTIEFKDFGILVDVIPNVGSDGAVTMRMRTEVSQPDFTLGIVPPGGGSTIPGFSRRSSVTEVTIRPNGTLALSGLIQNNVTRSISKVPVLSKIPILGSLFTSKRFQRNETELVIFVTPTVLDNPLPAGTTAPAGVVAVGNTTNVAAKLGNPGINSFDQGESVIPLTSQNSGGGR